MNLSTIITTMKTNFMTHVEMLNYQLKQLDGADASKRRKILERGEALAKRHGHEWAAILRRLKF